MPKAGTRWLYDQLSHHPDFWMPPGKELQYLHRDPPTLEPYKRHLEDWPKFFSYGLRNGFTWGERELAFVKDVVACAGQPRDIDRYAGLFRHKGNLLSGDISPGYCKLEDETIGEIAARLPETKILLLVREPISRAWSRICMAERDGEFDVSLLEDPAEFGDVLRRSRYITRYFATRVIRQWSPHYSWHTQFRVILFDDIVQRPEETLREILTFVGADPSRPVTLPADYNRKSGDRKLEMPDSIRKILAEYFNEETAACSTLLGGAAREWPVMAPPAARALPKVNGPDFICIGMPKAGTRWLYDQLSHHPDFWMPPGKELQYLHRDPPTLEPYKRHLEDWPKFVRYGLRNGLTWGERELAFVTDVVACAGRPRDIDRYASLFRHKGNLISGDISPGYCKLEDETIGEIAARLPDTKIILLVREPISRAWSRICMAERDGEFDVSLLDDPAEFGDFIRGSRHISGYFASKIIRHWSRHFPSRSQFRVILFDDIVQRPEETLRDILTFVGADPSRAGTLPADYNRKSGDRKLEMPGPIREILVGYFDEEISVCSTMLGGAARAWPVMAPPVVRYWWSFKRRVLSFSHGRDQFIGAHRSRGASRRPSARSRRALLSRVARFERAINRRKRQSIAFSRRAGRALVRCAMTPIPLTELLIDARSFVANAMIADCSVFLKDVLRLPERH